MPTASLALVRQTALLICRRRAFPMLASLTALGAILALPAGSVAKTCGNVTLGQRQSGQTVTVQRCEQVTIQLKEDFDGGYRWKATRAPAPSILKLASAKTVVTTPKGVVGGTDTRVWVYRAVGKGKTSLTLTESRSFAAHSQIAKFTLVVRVK